MSHNQKTDADDEAQAPCERAIFGPFADVIKGMSESEIEALCDRLDRVVQD